MALGASWPRVLALPGVRSVPSDGDGEARLWWPRWLPAVGAGLGIEEDDPRVTPGLGAGGQRLGSWETQGYWWTVPRARVRPWLWRSSADRPRGAPGVLPGPLAPTAEDPRSLSGDHQARRAPAAKSSLAGATPALPKPRQAPGAWAAPAPGAAGPLPPARRTEGSLCSSLAFPELCMDMPALWPSTPAPGPAGHRIQPAPSRFLPSARPLRGGICPQPPCARCRGPVPQQDVVMALAT